jgi:hypothetical protein
MGGSCQLGIGFRRPVRLRSPKLRAPTIGPCRHLVIVTQGAELTNPLLNQYSHVELLNRKFRRLTWLLSFVFLGVVVLLVLELTGVLPLSPF